ncbi:TPA: transcriptional repressor NrdR [Candidatus Micrarchaeota archaeon]|nr:transcriptional repressor NrdR [Candidatus Micrarchaeota archaeon]HIH30563.1 transcriptional repressor NrdR [Candidatus Micrarchaeota archaeon]
MKCPFCQHRDTDVIDTRDTDDFRIRRRRGCGKCKRRFTTYEEIEHEDLFIIKKDGRREKFDRHKLMSGLEKACEKRPVSREQIDSMAAWVEGRLRKSGKQEVTTNQIGELVMEKLRKTDDIAYIRFASVYRSFTDIDSFEKALRILKKKK